MAPPYTENDEWLEADGLGGFAMGTATGIPTRRYHSLLTVAANPPGDRKTLVNALETTLIEDGVSVPLSSFYYSPGVIHPNGCELLTSFSVVPFPRWTYTLPSGNKVIHEQFRLRGSPIACLKWQIPKDTTLIIRPLISCRDYHALHRANSSFNFTIREEKNKIYCKPYVSIPELFLFSSGSFAPEREWFYQFLYAEDQARGYEATEDLASIGFFTFTGATECYLHFGMAYRGEAALAPKESAGEAFERLSLIEQKRRISFPSPFHRAAEDFVVQRGEGSTIVAGYPWFTDWGRDTFISIRGLVLGQGKRKEAARILQEWSLAIDLGMVPNRFVEGNSPPEYNSVDASLWYIIATYELFKSYESAQEILPKPISSSLCAAIEVILNSYSQGTRYKIKLDHDGLLACGEPGQQLTWMDAKVGSYVVTPRIGKPVEIQALWLNALKIGTLLVENSKQRWEALYTRGLRSFTERFWNEEKSYLYDVIDCDHVYGLHDSRLRPNQVLTIGGLPFSILDISRGKKMLMKVRESLLTPLGLRTLAPGERGYAPSYNGDEGKRSFAYHQGTVWPWLLGPFIEGWVRAHGDTKEVRDSAFEDFVAPILGSLSFAANGHIPEIADAESPFHRKGCPFQAWSLAEILRVTDTVLHRPLPPLF